MKIKHNDLKQRYDIVIIGGGIAGLALSRFLNLENRKIFYGPGSIKQIFYKFC